MDAEWCSVSDRLDALLLRCTEGVEFGPKAVVRDTHTHTPVFDCSAVDAKLGGIVLNLKSDKTPVIIGNGTYSTVFSAKYRGANVTFKVNNNLASRLYELASGIEYKLPDTASYDVDLQKQMLGDEITNLRKVESSYVLEMIQYSNDVPFVIMPSMDKTSYSMVKNSPRCFGTLARPSALMIRFLNQMTLALTAMHSKGVAHMNVKPSNIYCVDDGFMLGELGGSRTENDIIPQNGMQPCYVPSDFIKLRKEAKDPLSDKYGKTMKKLDYKIFTIDYMGLGMTAMMLIQYLSMKGMDEKHVILRHAIDTEFDDFISNCGDSELMKSVCYLARSDLSQEDRKFQYERLVYFLHK